MGRTEKEGNAGGGICTESNDESALARYAVPSLSGFVNFVAFCEELRNTPPGRQRSQGVGASDDSQSSTYPHAESDARGAQTLGTGDLHRR